MAQQKPKGNSSRPRLSCLDRSQFVTPADRKARARIEYEHDQSCRINAEIPIQLAERWDVTIPFEDYYITDVCGDSEDNCEKVAEALFESGIQTVRDYRFARRAMILNCMEVQYIRNSPRARISTVGPDGLAAMDICIALQEQEYSKVANLDPKAS